MQVGVTGFAVLHLALVYFLQQLQTTKVSLMSLPRLCNGIQNLHINVRLGGVVANIVTS